MAIIVPKDQGPVVQGIISLTSSLVVKMLTVLVSKISNSQVFLLKKCEYLHFFSKNISKYVIFIDQSLNDVLTNDIVCFEQLGLKIRTTLKPMQTPMGEPKCGCFRQVLA